MSPTYTELKRRDKRKRRSSMTTVTTMGAGDAIDHGIDPNASPLDTNTTPDTELSPPHKPLPERSQGQEVGSEGEAF